MKYILKERWFNAHCPFQFIMQDRDKLPGHVSLAGTLLCEPCVDPRGPNGIPCSEFDGPDPATVSKLTLTTNYFEKSVFCYYPSDHEFELSYVSGTTWFVEALANRNIPPGTGTFYEDLYKGGLHIVFQTVASQVNACCTITLSDSVVTGSSYICSDYGTATTLFAGKACSAVSRDLASGAVVLPPDAYRVTGKDLFIQRSPDVIYDSLLICKSTPTANVGYRISNIDDSYVYENTFTQSPEPIFINVKW